MAREIGQAVATWLEANRDFIRSGFDRALDRVATVTRALVTGVRFLVRAYQDLVSVMGPLQTSIFNIGLALIPLIIALGLPAVLLLAIGVALFALVEDFQNMGDGVDSVSGRILTNLQDLIDQTGSFGAAMEATTSAALSSLLEFFGVSRDAADDWSGFLLDVLLAPFKALKFLIVDVNKFLTASIQLLMDKFGSAFRLLSQGISAIGSFLPEGTAAAVAKGAIAGPAVIAGPAASAGLSLIVNNQTDVQVDASGNADVPSVVRGVSQGVQGGQTASLRQNVQSFRAAR
jgi:hypothetical protein